MPVIAVVPAAGKGERFGGNKLLARIKGEPLINWTLWSLLDGGVERIVVVTAPSTDLSSVPLMKDPRVRFVVNPDPSPGMLSSVQVGIAAAEGGDPILILPGDMPFVASSTVTAVTVACIRHDQVVVPTFDQRRGHPIAVPAMARDVILSAPASATLKAALAAAPRLELPVGDLGILRDVDLPEDLT
jgi:molybdenum cofactor cytidylyltransferase